MSIYTRDMPNIVNDPHSTIGEFTYGPISIERAYDGAISKFIMGKFGSIGQGVRAVYFGSHQLYSCTVYPFSMLHGRGWPPVYSEPVNGQDIIVGNDVYLANFSILMQGCIIPDGCVVGAFSIVKSKKLKPYHIYVGNPARSVGQRFPDDKIEKLLKIQWWNWDLEKIKEHLQLISSPNVDQLYEVYLKEIK